jgi:cation diffusion facilitator family transporter
MVCNLAEGLCLFKRGKMPSDSSNLNNVPRLEARAAAISLGVGAALMLAKFAAFFLTGSAAIFSDALESIVNVAAAAFATYSLFLAHQPADADHPYGHGKIEFLSAGFEGGMVLLAAVVAAIQALIGLVRGSPDLRSGNLINGLLLIGCTVVVNACLGAYLIRTGRRNDSLALEADGHHLISDVWSGAFALAGVGAVALTRWKWIDPLAAILVAVFISRTGISLIRRSAAGLMDKQDQDDSRMLKELLDSHVGPAGKDPRICSYHKLRHRHSGRYHWVDFHLVLPSEWDIARGHAVATTIEDEIEEKLREGNATSHIEPCIHPECALCQAVHHQTDDAVGR